MRSKAALGGAGGPQESVSALALVYRPRLRLLRRCLGMVSCWLYGTGLLVGIANWAGVRWDGAPTSGLERGESRPSGWRWFPNGQLNYAERMLAPPAGAGEPPRRS